MKYLKKFASLALALVMVLALAAPAFAEGEGDTVAEPNNVTVKLVNGTGHTFTGYQIFVAARETDKTLKTGTFKWGTNVKALTLVNAIIDAFGKGNNDALNDLGTELNTIKAEEANMQADTAANKVAEVISKYFENGGAHDNTADQTKLAKAIYESGALDTIAATITPGTNGTVQTGWCLFIDKMGSDDKNPTYIVKQITNTADKVYDITTKSEDSKLKKQIWDEKKPALDENGKEIVEDGKTKIDAGWSDGAVYPIGKEIKFQLTITLPDELTQYRTEEKPYNIVIHDSQFEGFELIDIDSVVLNPGGDDKELVLYDKDKPNETYSTLTVNKNGPLVHTADKLKEKAPCSFEIKIDNVEGIDKANARDTIVVSYRAKLNEKALIGTPGNNNEAWLEENGEPGPGDNVKAFVLELDVNKVDGDGNPLSGAQFALFPAVAQKDEETGDITYVKQNPNDKTGYPLTPNATDIKDKDGKVIWPAGTHFTITSKTGTDADSTAYELDDGIYILEETDTPKPGNYNPITPIIVEIKSKIIETPTTEPGKLEVTVSKFENGKATVEDGKVVTQVENLEGTLLPSTGGIGTTIFYIAGGVLLVGAVVLLIAKRRTSADDE